MADAPGGEAADHSLKRALGAGNLVLLGIGAIIGAGIFVLTGQAAANYAGPGDRLLVHPGGRRLRASPDCATPSSRR